MKRVLSLLLVCLIVLSPTAVFAQSDSTMPVICGDLDEETCDLLHQSQAAMKEVASSVQNTEFQLSMQNAPQFPVKDASVDLNVAQVTYVDTEYMKEVETMMLGASEAMADDMEGFMEDYMAAIAGVYSHLSLDMEMDIELSEEIAQFASDQAGFDVPTNLATDIRLVDGILYINLDDISSAMPDLGIPTGWFGVEIAALMEEQMAKAAEEMANPSEEMQAQMASMMMGMSFANMGQNEELVDALNQIVVMERMDDTEVNGTAVAEVVGVVDFTALLTNETILNLVFEVLKNSGQDIPELDSMDPAEVAGMLQLVAPMLTQGLDWTQTQHIGLEDGLVYGTAIDMTWDMSSVLQLAAVGMGGKPAKRSKDKTVFEMHVASESSDFNDAPEISAPEEVMIIPLSELE